MRDPILKDVRVRHAIGYAIDRQAIVDHLRRGLATPSADSMLPPTNWALEPDVFDFDLRSRARQSAPRRSRLSAIPTATARAPRLSLSLQDRRALEFNRLQSAVIQQNLRDVGIDIDVRSVRVRHAVCRHPQRQLPDVYAAVGRAAPWPTPTSCSRVFHSQQVPPAGFNRGHFSDPEVDRLIDEAIARHDYESAARCYGEVQQRVAELAPYISLWHRDQHRAGAARDSQASTCRRRATSRFLRNVSR